MAPRDLLAVQVVDGLTAEVARQMARNSGESEQALLETLLGVVSRDEVFEMLARHRRKGGSIQRSIDRTVRDYRALLDQRLEAF